jgi:hypothetical protein
MNVALTSSVYLLPPEIFVYLLSLKSYSIFRFGLKIILGGQILGVWGHFTSKMLCDINATPKRHFLAADRVV